MTLSSLPSALVALFLLLLMFGMGATLTRERFAAVLARPTPLVIGLVSQLLWMPFAAFVIARALELPAPVAIGLVIMGCSTGGTSSNFFTYFGRADLALSISMTVCSTVVGIVAIPIVLAIYTRPWVSPEPGIPYPRIMATLVAVIVPVTLGLLLRARSETWAIRAERIGSVCGWGVLALAIVALSFPAEVAPQVLLAPLLYGVIVVPCSAVVAYAFRRDGAGSPIR